MPETILFYFDFISPYGYLGSVEVERIAARHGWTVDWRPVLLGITVLKVMGLKGVADTPLKRDYVRHDVPRMARLLGIPFDRAGDGVMQPLPAARAFVWLKQQDGALAKRFGQAVYAAHWAEGRDMSSADAVADVAAAIGIDRAALLAAQQDDGVKAKLRDDVAEAIGAGVFGVPSFVAGGEMFWGADRLPMLERWLESGGW